MTTAGVLDITSENSQQEEDPRPIELPSVGPNHYGCVQSSWCIFSWIVSLVLYTVECFVTIWVAYTYANDEKFVPFGITLAYLAIPQVVLVTLSLIWYYNLDRFHRKRKDNDPHNLEFIEYKKKLNLGTIVCHILLLGMVYRHAQLIYQVLIRKMNNVPYLRRDTTLLRLFHSLIVSAPLVVLHLYVLLQYLPNCLSPETFSTCQIADFPSVFAAFGSSLATLLYSVLAFATNDRLSGKNRRVIFPAHLTQVLWYLCVLSSRMLAIALFAFAYNYYVFAFVGGHWLIMFLFLLIQKTTFCADVIRETDSKVVIKRRWYLEIPFDFIAATVYVFGFIGFRKGNTRYWAIFYHVLTYAEIGAMSALFYTKFSTVSHLYVFSLTALTLTAGLYPTGLLFMFAYYLFFHPNKTENWYKIGVPKLKASNSNRESRSIANQGFRNQTPDSNNARLDISGPVLVAHNGFIPRGMLPEDVPSSPGDDRNIVTNPTDIITQSQQRSTERPRNWNSAQPTSSVGHQNFVTSLSMLSPSSTGKSTTVASEALIPVILSDGPSDLGTDLDSSVLHVPQGEIKGDTVIDTPLFGNTPDPTMQRRLKVDSGDPGTLRSLTDTVDTGIDLGTDTPLTQEHQDGSEVTNSSRLYNNSSRQRESMSLGLDIDMPHFSNIPVKKHNFQSKKSTLESHYFPDSQCQDDLTPTLPTPSWEHSGHKSLLGQNSSGESGEMYQSQAKSSVSGHRQHHVVPLTISPPEKTRRSTPRSPKGARAFTVSTSEDNRPPALSRNRASYPSSHTTTTESPYHSTPAPKPHAPRSPKGAKRMMISQPKPEPIELHSNRHSFVNPAYHDPRSPPRHVLNYQRAPPPSGSMSAKTPDGRRRSNVKPPQPVKKSHSMNSHVRSPERTPRGAPGYRREHPPQRHSRYMQQQAENRSRWDKWAAEQEEKRRQAKSEKALTQSYPGPSIPRNISEEFDHLEPIISGNDQNSTDGASAMNVSASIAPQGYPRAPQGARGGDKPRFGWSPSRSDRISSSPQRSTLSANASLNASLNATPAHREDVRLSTYLSPTSHKKFYAPTRSMHQSVV